MAIKKTRKIQKVAFVYRMMRHTGRTLITSLLDEMKARDIQVEEFNLYNEYNLYDPSVLDSLYSTRSEYDVVFVLDLGYLFDYRVHKDQYECPVVFIAGDDPQNFEPKKGFVQKLKRFLKLKVASLYEHNELLGNSLVAKQYDIILTHQKSSVTEYQKKGYENVHWLPYWCDAFIHYDRPEIKPEFDVVTVMTPRPNRQKVMDALANSKKFSFNNGYGKFNNECAEHYQKGKILYNQSNYNEFTIRIPEALGDGCFVLTDEIPKETGLYELLTPGVHFVTYTDQEDLEKKIAYYLEHDDERKRIAAAGHKEVLNHHTQKHRLDYIFDIVSDYEKEIRPHKVSIHMISWNRPWLLAMTLSSLKNSLKDSYIDYEVIVYDQNSHPETRNILRDNFDFIDKIVSSPKNDGMAKAWVKMYQVSNAEYIMPIENDWWCNANSDAWLKHALEIIENQKNMAFVKLRTIRDGQYGTGSLTHEPWTVRPFPSDIVQTLKLSDGTPFYVAGSKYNCFTFNPLLIKKAFRDEFDKYYLDNASNYDPRRSGEDLPSAKWQEQEEWVAASLTDGPFKHIGFPELKEHARYTPFFLVGHFFNLLLGKFRK